MLLFSLLVNSLLLIGVIDNLLIYIFGNKARWFQLHALINLIIVILVIDDSIKLIKAPIKNYKEYNINDNSNNINISIVVSLHLYHILFFNNLKFLDYCHHIIFVFFGVLPCYYFINSNILKLSFLAGCGLPGLIEYSLLSLVKNDKLDKLIQKKILMYVYCYFRSPLSLLSCIINYFIYTENLIKSNIYFYIYLNVLIFINSTYYNKLTIQNYYETKLL